MKSGVWFLLAAATLCACATPGEGDRVRLGTEELQTLKPAMAEHLICVSGKVGLVTWPTADVNKLVDAAAEQCRDTLGPLAERLKMLNLTAAAHARYVTAVDAASREVVASRAIKARTESARRGHSIHGEKAAL